MPLGSGPKPPADELLVTPLTANVSSSPGITGIDGGTVPSSGSGPGTLPGSARNGLAVPATSTVVPFKTTATLSIAQDSSLPPCQPVPSANHSTVSVAA